ncbi:hypothetical protein BDY24DRAFT_442504 [Mrakia frigida]|uniref:uncharacterized protein n=1 Tax=Mrakia frigida TaxID=29902 RepID=UPI003FCC1C1B
MSSPLDSVHSFQSSIDVDVSSHGSSASLTILAIKGREISLLSSPKRTRQQPVLSSKNHLLALSTTLQVTLLPPWNAVASRAKIKALEKRSREEKLKVKAATELAVASQYEAILEVATKENLEKLERADEENKELRKQLKGKYGG